MDTTTEAHWLCKYFYCQLEKIPFWIAINENFIKMDYSSLHSVSQFDPAAKLFNPGGYG